MSHFIEMVFEANAQNITWWAMCIRGTIIFLFGILLLRIGEKRIFSPEGAFDIALSIVVGSLLAKAIAGNGKFIPIMSTCIVMIIAHWLLSRISYNYRSIGKFVKGSPELLVKDGKIIIEAMKRNNITTKDLEEALRIAGHLPDITKAKEMHIERNGRISVIEYENGIHKKNNSLPDDFTTLR